MVLDGRTRLRACLELGILCPTQDFEGHDPLGFVVSMNLRRRHLDESQRGMVAARLANLSPGRPEKTPPIDGVSHETAATLLNVGLRTVERAKKIQCQAIPEVIQAVDTGELGVPQRPAGEAARLARGLRATEGEGVFPSLVRIGRAGAQHEPAIALASSGAVCGP